MSGGGEFYIEVNHGYLELPELLPEEAIIVACRNFDDDSMEIEQVLFTSVSIIHMLESLSPAAMLIKRIPYSKLTCLRQEVLPKESAVPRVVRIKFILPIEVNGENDETTQKQLQFSIRFDEEDVQLAPAILYTLYNLTEGFSESANERQVAVQAAKSVMANAVAALKNTSKSLEVASYESS